MQQALVGNGMTASFVHGGRGTRRRRIWSAVSRVHTVNGSTTHQRLDCLSTCLRPHPPSMAHGNNGRRNKRRLYIYVFHVCALFSDSCFHRRGGKRLFVFLRLSSWHACNARMQQSRLVSSPRGHSSFRLQRQREKKKEIFPEHRRADPQGPNFFFRSRAASIRCGVYQQQSSPSFVVASVGSKPAAASTTHGRAA